MLLKSGTEEKTIEIKYKWTFVFQRKSVWNLKSVTLLFIFWSSQKDKAMQTKCILISFVSRPDKIALIDKVTERMGHKVSQPQYQPGLPNKRRKCALWQLKEKTMNSPSLSATTGLSSRSNSQHVIFPWTLIIVRVSKMLFLKTDEVPLT